MKIRKSTTKTIPKKKKNRKSVSDVFVKYMNTPVARPYKGK